MTSHVKLANQDIQVAITELGATGWSLVKDGKAVSKTFKFRNFSQAIGWMVQCALFAEKLNHHPEWFNVYNRVEVTLTTHSTGSLTDLDFRLARRMDRLAER